jgi:hypothetical protein
MSASKDYSRLLPLLQEAVHALKSEHTDHLISVRVGLERAIARMQGGTMPCDGCGCEVAPDDHCGNDRGGEVSEYLCPDCYVPEGE